MPLLKKNFKNRVSSFAFKKEKTGMSNEGIFSIFSILRKSNVHSTTFHFECKWLADFNPSRAAKWMICISILIEKSPATHFPLLYVKLILITVIFKLPILLMIPIANLKLGGVV